MKVRTLIQQHLRWKLFLSYAVIVLVGSAVLLATAQWRAPTVITHHTARMESMMGSMMGGANPAIEQDWRASFMDSLNEIMVAAVAAAMLAAFLMSLYVSQRIVEPVRQVRFASQHIAQGDYHKRIQIVSRDELGDLASAFNQMAQDLEQTEQRRLELVGNVAHELRTPLGSLQAMMEGLIDGVLPGEPATYVNIQSELDRLQRLVQDLQELSRVEARQLALDQKPVQIDELIATAAARLRPQFDDKNVHLELSLADDVPVVTADPDRIMQVLVNLLGNALQYTPAGGSVAVTAEAAGHEMVVTVSDTGIGIDPEHLPHLFERFYRVDKSRSRTGGGSGIGLTIARHLVEAHGGAMRAASPGPGQGSTFTFTLPVAR
jgi:signal transduction histidine kinase